MVIGTAGDLPPPPTEKIVFLEDMTDAELADAVSCFSDFPQILSPDALLLISFGCLWA